MATALINERRHGRIMIETVFRTVESRSAPAVSRVAAFLAQDPSSRHGLHPGEKSAPMRIEGSQLRHRRDKSGSLLQIASPTTRPGMFGLVGQSRPALIVSDGRGWCQISWINAAPKCGCNTDVNQDYGGWRDWCRLERKQPSAPMV